MPKKTEKRVKWQQYGILNRFGTMWTPKTFETIAEAERYKEVFWGNIENPPDMSKHKIVVVNVFPSSQGKGKNPSAKLK